MAGLQQKLPQAGGGTCDTDPWHLQAPARVDHPAAQLTPFRQGTNNTEIFSAKPHVL